jgi:hypothetical protein
VLHGGGALATETPKQLDGLTCVHEDSTRHLVVFTERITLLKLLPDEQNCVVNGLKFSLIQAIKVVEVAFESSVFMHERHIHQPLNK